MLEEDPAKITVHLVQFEKYVPFCMPGAEGTNAFVVTWLRTDGRTIVAALFGRRGVVCVHHGGRCALGVCAVGVVSLSFSCAVCCLSVTKRMFAAAWRPQPSGWGREETQGKGEADFPLSTTDEARSGSSSVSSFPCCPAVYIPKREAGRVLVRVVLPLLCTCTAPHDRLCSVFNV